MYSGLVHAHSGLRWIVLLLLLVAIVSALGGLSGNKPFTSGVKRSALFALIFVHLQLVIGLVLYFISPKVQHGPNTFSDDVLRFYSVEHLTTMLIGIAIITIGYSRSKRASTDGSKYKTLFWFYLIGLIIVLAGIPWPFRGVGAGMF